MRTVFFLSWIVIPLVLNAQGVQRPYGLPVGEVSLEGAPDTVRDVIPIRLGDSLTVDAVRASMQALFEEGAYGRIELDAEPNGSGSLDLTFRVEDPYFFATVTLNPSTLLERPISNYLNLPYGERFAQNQVDRILVGVKDQLLQEGFFEAEVRPTYAFDEQSRLVTIIVEVTPGPLARVGSLRFEGGQETFTEGELRRSLSVREASEFRRERLEAGIENIRSDYAELGFLNTIVDFVESYDRTRNAVDVTVSIQPGPFTLVQVRGYEIETSAIRGLVPVFEEGSVDPDLIEEGRVGILERLRQDGYFQATVVSELIAAPRDNAFQINYVVTSGERYLVREVRIEGNSFFETDVLRNATGISRNGLFRQGVFSPELLEGAADTLRRMYRAAGFAGTRVDGESFVEGNAITAVLRIVEGHRLVIESVRFGGDMTLGPSELADLVNLRPGAVYTPAVVEGARRRIASAYHARGYPDVRVETEVEPSADGMGMDIVYNVREGTAYSIGRIFVSGNTRTREMVVLRNSELVEGDAYDPEAILEAQQRLYATGLFNRVEIVTLARERNRTRDLLIQLEDASPLLLTYGVGVQDREGPRGTVELTHSNLWGLDRSLSFRIRGSRREQRFQTTYREPRLFNWDLDGFASLFLERTRQQFFDANRIDFSLQTLKQFTLRDSLLVSASYQTVNLRDIRVNPRANEFPDETGTIHISRMGASYIRDSRNDPINPTGGNYITGSLQVADRRWGSQVSFVSMFTQAALYRPAKSTVLAASFRLGWNKPYGRTNALPITERYFAGGSTTLRAFGQDEAGPEGGGEALVIVNAEYRFPIPFLFGIDALGGAAFYDSGTTFRRMSNFTFGDFTHTIGFGFRYRTPIGPIRADFGFNVNRQPNEPENQFFITLGQTF